MTLEESYKKIKSSIVAIIPKFLPSKSENEEPPAFPPIIGTGFIVADGLVVTNAHVVQELKRLPKPKNFPPKDFPAVCVLLHNVPQKGVVEVAMDISGAFRIDSFNPGTGYMGPAKPDVAFLRVNMKDLPCVEVKYRSELIKEGRDVATAGFPMGTDCLMAPKSLHQLTPTLQKGIISAILPCECEMPHSIMVNIMLQGGASGSPVFLPETGEVIGVIYAGLMDKNKTLVSKDTIEPHSYKLPTNLSYCVPSYYIEPMIETFKSKNEFRLSDNAPSFIERIETCQVKTAKQIARDRYDIWQ